jgi:hypothetical protein
MGAHVLSCPQGHFSTTQYHACRHRCCPRCAQRPRQQWLATQLRSLLPCPHFHLIFTLPRVFVALWQFNRALIAQMLFDSVRSSVLALCADPRHLGATPGLLMALHTWGRTLSRHPHVHCLASAGGIDAHDQWRACASNFLVPVEPLRQLFRAKLLCALRAALDHHRLALPPKHDAAHWRTIIARQWRAHWNLQINAPYAHGRGVALYLARYVKGGPLGSDRRLHLGPDSVAFAYFDHLSAKRRRLTLEPDEFIERILWHAPPRGQHTVRHAGLYASALRRQHRICLRLLSPQLPPATEPALACHALHASAQPTALCPACRTPLQRTYVRPAPHQDGEFSQSTPATPVQLGPTGRCSGQTPARTTSTLRRRPLRRGSPLN